MEKTLHGWEAGFNPFRGSQSSDSSSNQNPSMLFLAPVKSTPDQSLLQHCNLIDQIVAIEANTNQLTDSVLRN